MSKVISVSIKDSQKAWLDKHETISPSDLIQEAIEDLIKITDRTRKELDEVTKQLQKRNKCLEIAGEKLKGTTYENLLSDSMFQAVKLIQEDKNVAI